MRPMATAGNPSNLRPVGESRALLDNRAGAHDASGADEAVVADDRPRFDHGAVRCGSVGSSRRVHNRPVLDHQLVVREQVQNGVLENLDVVADAHGAVRVSDDLHTGAR